MSNSVYDARRKAEQEFSDKMFVRLATHLITGPSLLSNVKTKMSVNHKYLSNLIMTNND